MKSHCSKIVKVNPAPGATDRNPPDRCCRRPVYVEGLCKMHHTGYNAEKEAVQAARNERWQVEETAKQAAQKAELQTQRDAIDEAILLLVKSGYFVTLPKKEEKWFGSGMTPIAQAEEVAA